MKTLPPLTKVKIWIKGSRRSPENWQTLSWPEAQLAIWKAINKELPPRLKGYLGTAECRLDTFEIRTKRLKEYLAANPEGKISWPSFAVKGVRK